MELMLFKKMRTEVLCSLKGKCLEVGVGTGKNIPFYPDGIDMTAIDFSEKMLEKAKHKAYVLSKNINFYHMDVQNMDFDDNAFDFVFTTCVFCSVPDPIKGLMEIKRVCRPDGKIIMIEHVRSEKKVIGLIMDILNPVTVNLYGANINRKTVENVKKAGYTQISVTNLSGDIIKKIEISNHK
jgi:ubiquinone/menaquinone biosynthesis C-methylase UbiE